MFFHRLKKNLKKKKKRNKLVPKLLIGPVRLAREDVPFLRSKNCKGFF